MSTNFSAWLQSRNTFSTLAFVNPKENHCDDMTFDFYLKPSRFLALDLIAIHSEFRRILMHQLANGWLESVHLAQKMNT